jgi:hypothetical protein
MENLIEAGEPVKECERAKRAPRKRPTYTRADDGAEMVELAPHVAVEIGCAQALGLIAVRTPKIEEGAR